MNSTSNRLQEIEQNDFNLNIEEVLKQAFDNYKKIALTVGALLLLVIIPFTIIGSLAAISFGIQNLIEMATRINLSEYSLLLIAFNFSVPVIGAALVAPLTAGILKICQNAFNNEHFGLPTAFHYYKGKYFTPLFTAALIIAIVTSGADALANLYKAYAEPGFVTNLLTLIISLLSGLIGLLTLMTIPLIIFKDFAVSEAIQGSVKLVSKKFWHILALVLIGAFCSIIFGLMALCIGIFFTLPFMYSLQYAIYRNMMGIEKESLIEE